MKRRKWDAGGRPRNTGCYVVIAGPDGTGKSTITEQLSALLQGEVLRLHHRPGVLPHRTRGEGRSLEPHGQPPHGRLVSIAKLVYLWLDHLIGWHLQIRPVVRRGGVVLMERGWWDLAVDQARYRLNAPPAGIHFLGRLLPRPDRTIVLTGDAEVILARKAELSPDELVGQLDAWRALPTAELRAVAIDATLPLETVVTRAHAVIRDLRR